MTKTTPYQRPATISQAYCNPRYQGKIVIESPEGLHSTTDDKKAVQLLRRLNKKYDETQVVTTIIPKGPMVSIPVELKQK